MILLSRSAPIPIFKGRILIKPVTLLLIKFRLLNSLLISTSWPNKMLLTSASQDISIAKIHHVIFPMLIMLRFNRERSAIHFIMGVTLALVRLLTYFTFSVNFMRIDSSIFKHFSSILLFNLKCFLSNFTLQFFLEVYFHDAGKEHFILLCDQLRV